MNIQRNKRFSLENEIPFQAKIGRKDYKPEEWFLSPYPQKFSQTQLICPIVPSIKNVRGFPRLMANPRRKPLRLAGILLPGRKNLGIALTALYGIGKSTAVKILDSVNIDPRLKTYELDYEQRARLRDEIKEYEVEGSLRRKKAVHELRLDKNGSLRGRRQRLGFPSRGQRTKTNGKTAKKFKRGTEKNTKKVTTVKKRRKDGK